jgi:hypothetical protein
MAHRVASQAPVTTVMGTVARRFAWLAIPSPYHTMRTILTPGASGAGRVRRLRDTCSHAHDMIRGCGVPGLAVEARC